METIHAIFASTSGNVEMTVEAVTNRWREKGYQIELHRSEMVSPEIIDQNKYFLFATSTWDRGEMNPYFNPIFEKIAQTDCHSKSAFFVGCGDFRYEPILFNMGIQKIHDTWVKQGGQVVHHPLKINGDPQLAMEKVVFPWIEETFSDLESLTKEQQ